MASARVWMTRARKALHMSPRYALGRLRDELREEARRPWERIYPRILSDATILGDSAASSIDDLWQRQLEAPFFVRPSDRHRYVTAHAHRFPSARARIVSTADAALRHEVDLLGSGPRALGDQLPWLDDFAYWYLLPSQYCGRAVNER